MASADNQAMRFLQQECTRLKDQNELLDEELQALRRYVRELQAFQDTLHNFSPEQDIMELLEFVLNTTYFSFRGQIYQQKFGTAMGSPVLQTSLWKTWNSKPLPVPQKNVGQSSGNDTWMTL